MLSYCYLPSVYDLIQDELMLRAVKNCQAALSFRVALPFRDELMFPVVNYDSDAVMDLDVPLPPDESVHCADGRKNSGGNEPNQNSNDDKNGKISALLPDTE